MSTLLHNLKFSFRLLVRNPLSSLVLILTLALGIGVNAAIFSIVDTVLLRPLPFPDSHELVAIWEAEDGGRDDIPVADGNLFDIQDKSSTLTHVAAYVSDTTLVHTAQATFRAGIGAMTKDFFDVFQVGAQRGRLPTPEEHGDGTPVVAVLSHDFWQSAFGGVADVLGRQIDVYGESSTIVGVMPPGFDFPRGSDVWIDFERYIGRSRTAHNLRVVGRLDSGHSLEEAQNELRLLADNLAAAYPAEIDSGFHIAVRSLHKDQVGDARSTLILLYCIVGVVLLIACGNIAGILLTRTIARTRELGIRQAVGAGNREIVVQLLLESATLGVVGSIGGLALARWSISLLNRLVPETLLHSGPVAVDVRVVTFAILLGIVTGLLCGVAPVLRILRRSPIEAVRSGTLVAARGGRPRQLGSLFVVPQYAFSFAALMVAGLLVKSLLNLVNVDPGYDTHGVVTAEMTLAVSPPSRYADPEVLAGFYHQVVDEVGALPGVETVTLAHSLPLAGKRINGLAVREGDPMPQGNDLQFYPDYRVVGSDYFAATGTPIFLGRDFARADSGTAEPVAIVNEALSRQMWGEENPVGRRLVLPGLDFDEEGAERLLTVVGVARDVRSAGFDSAPRPAVYVPWLQHLTRARTLNVVAAVSSDPVSLVEPIRERIRAQDPGMLMGPVQTMEDWVRLSTSEPRFRANLLTGFAGLAILLAALGVYGVMSYTLSKRQREVAIRMAVGASRRNILTLMLKSAALFVAFGQILGILAAVALTRLLDGLLFEVETTDLSVFLGATVTLAAVVLLTCYIPARNASTLNPVAMLKQE